MNTTTTTSKRPTVADTLAQIADVREAVTTLTGIVSGLADLVSRSQAFTPVLVAETIDDEQRYAEPSHAGKTTRNARKSASKATTKATPAKATPARKSAPAKATPKLVSVVSLEDAQARVDAGEDAWKIMVASSTTGAPIPFGKVRRALRAAERKAGTTIPAKKAPAKKVTRAQADTKRVFALGSKELAALAADGDKAAQAEIARRAAKRAAK